MHINKNEAINAATSHAAPDAASHTDAGSPAEAVHQWRQRAVGSFSPAWHDASKDEAYERVGTHYEARTLYTRPSAGAPILASPHPTTPHTFGAFSRSFYDINKRQASPQEVFDAGMRAGRSLQWPEPMPASAAPDPLLLQRMESTVSDLKGEIEHHKDRVRAANLDLNMRRQKEVGEVWYWQHEGGNNVESITCPIVIPAQEFRDLLAAAPVPASETASVDTPEFRELLAEWFNVDDAETAYTCVQYGRIITHIASLPAPAAPTDKENL